MATKPIVIEWMEFIPIRFMFALVQILPYHFSLALGRWISLGLYYCVPPLRRITFAGLKQAFGNTHSKKERIALAKACYKHFGMVFMEFMLLPKLHRQNKIHTKVDFGNSLQVIEQLLQRGKGIIAVAAHFGNWELMTAATSSLGYPIHVIVRLLDNRLLDTYVESIREQFGSVVIDKKKATWAGFRCVKNNGVLAFLIDQNTAFNMVFVPFFGKQAATTRGPVIFSRRLVETPIMAAWSWRDEKNILHIVFEEIPVDHSIKDPAEFERVHMGKFTRYFEDVIRKHPEQWLWWHERWKSYPEEQKQPVNMLQ